MQHHQKQGLTKDSTAYNNAALKDIFLNDTPILKSTATIQVQQTSDFNFQNVDFYTSFWNGNQEHAFQVLNRKSSQSTGVGVTVTNMVLSPVTRQIQIQM